MVQANDGRQPARRLRLLSPLQRVGYTWLQGLRAWPASIRTSESRLGGLGFLWVVGCLPAIVLSILSPVLRPSPKRAFWLLLAVTTGLFIITPMNWWARYTLWIYALGLPCLAMVLQRLRQVRRGRLLALVYGSICAALVIFEGGYAILYALDSAFPGPLIQQPRQALSLHNWRWSDTYLFPELEGTAYDELLANGRVVAIGPANWPDAPWLIFGMLGQLSQPIGSRRIVHLGPRSSAEDLAKRSVQYVVWDKNVPIPEDIGAVLDYSKPAGRFLILHVRQDHVRQDTDHAP